MRGIVAFVAGLVAGALTALVTVAVYETVLQQGITLARLLDLVR